MSEPTVVPFGRGETYSGGGTQGATDGLQLEGQKKHFWDATYNQWVECMCVRNASGIALQPSRLVKFKAGLFGRQVDGYSSVTRDGPCVVVDDKLTGTVQANELFWVVIGGPCLIKTDMASLQSFVQNAPVYAATAANSTAAGTTGVGGRIDAPALGGNTATQAQDAAVNQVGYAMTARTTNNTDTLTLVYVCPNRF